MNRIYRLVWSRRAGRLVAVSERASGHRAGSTRKALGAGALVAALLASGQATAGGATPALPAGANIVAGNVRITSSGNAMTVTEGSNQAIIDWQGFNIGSTSTVNFVQPSASAVLLNRVVGGAPATIQGALNANGRVFLLDTSGILFGRQAQVNVGSLLASTLDISDADFLAGRWTFSSTSSGAQAVTNQGRIGAAPGGFVGLVGGSVLNQGRIQAQLGTVALAAGDRVSLHLNGDALIGVSVDRGTLNALVRNEQAIVADGGSVVLTARGLDTVLSGLVNNTGLIQARTVANRAGHILLLGDMQTGTVEVGGTIDASAPDGGAGGFVETSAAHVHVDSGARVGTAAASGLSGSWLIDPQDFTVAATGGDITGATLSSNLAGGNVQIQSSSGAGTGSGSINVNDAVSWSANTLTLTAANNVNINAVMTASGSASLALNPATANGADAAVSTGAVIMGMSANAYTGRVDFSGSGTLSIGGATYTVINSLGTSASSGDGSLQGMQGNLAGNYALGSNIDASATSGWNAGAGFTPIGNAPSSFAGNFAGLGHTITNLTINTAGSGGLFGITAANTVLNGFGLVNASITGGETTGAIVASLGGTLANAFATGSVIGPASGPTYVGGLVGASAASATISGSHAAVAVTGGNYVGGLIGENGGTIQSSYATGAVNGAAQVGGLAGASSGGTIIDSYATGNVSGGSAVGGLVGYMFFGTVSGTASSAPYSTYASGNVSGGDDVGGLVGKNVGGIITTSSALGAQVNGGNYVGGLAGWSYGSTISQTLATAAVTGTGISVGGLVGRNGNGNPTSISSSTATGAVSGAGNVGGLVGYGYITPIDGSHASGNVSGTGNNVGGLLGLQAGSNITNSSASGNVTASSGNNVGGLIGLVGNSPLSTVTGCSASGAVTGSNYVGGLVGYVRGGHTFTNDFATGAVSGANYVGGLAGYSQNSAIFTNTYATGPVNGANDVGGLVGGATYGTAINNSYASGNVNATGNEVGGLVGSLAYYWGYSHGTLSNSFYNTDAVLINGAHVLTAGGIFNAQYQAWFNSSASLAAKSLNIANYSATLPCAGACATPIYVVSSVQGMRDMLGFAEGNDAAYTFRLGVANLSLAGSPGLWIPYLAGSIDGAGGRISNATVNLQNIGGVSGSNDSNVGLIGIALGSVSNLGADNVAISGQNNVGGLVGYSYGTITGSHASGTVSGARNVGGLVGLNNSGAIQSSYATGSVSGSSYVGGLVGFSYGAIATSFSSAAVAGTPAANYVGGLVGKTSASITDSYASGGVTTGTGSSNVGGLAGSSYGAVSTSYASGAVSEGAGSSNVGGLIGSAGSAAVTSSYWNSDASTTGFGYGSPSVTGGGGLSAAQFLQAASFGPTGSAAGQWNFSSTWFMYPGATAPLLQVFMTPLTIGISPGLSQTYSGQLYASAAGLSYSVTADPAHLIGSVAYTGQGSANVGAYTITPGGYTSDQLGYIISYAPGSLTVNPATLTYTANSVSQVAGSSIGALTGAVSGFVNSETLASATTGTLAFTSSAGAASPAGSYAIDGTGLSANNGNYVFAQAAGNATALTLTAPGGSGSGGSGSGSGGSGATSNGSANVAAQFFDNQIAAVLATAAAGPGPADDSASSAPSDATQATALPANAQIAGAAGASFPPGTPLMLASSPVGGEPDQVVTLGQVRAILPASAAGGESQDATGSSGSGQGGDSSPAKDVRIPASRNSLEAIVNGGVRLPGGVEQQLFVVKAK